MKKVNTIFLIFVFIIGCRGTLNVLSDESLDEQVVQPSLQINNSTINEIIDYVETQQEFDAWVKSEYKIVFLSILKANSNTFLIKAVPSFRKKYALPPLNNDFKGYAFYHNTLIVIWGDYKYFFKKTSNTKRVIFNPKELKETVRGENYGTQFIIKDNKIISIQKQYYDTPLLE